MIVMADSPVRSDVFSPPTLLELFLAFAAVALSAFGGALPWTRRVIVERKGWMSADEFNEAFAMSQFLPGPNIVNFAVVFGTRFGGLAGAAVALAGFLGPPLVLVSILAVLYERYGDVETVGRILGGVSAAAAGFLVAITAKMAAPLFKTRLDWRPIIVVIAFISVALARWPLPYVLAVLAPVSILLMWLRPPQP